MNRDNRFCVLLVVGVVQVIEVVLVKGVTALVCVALVVGM